MSGKLLRTHPTLHGHFAPAYLVGSNMLSAYLFFIYAKYSPAELGYIPVELRHTFGLPIARPINQ